MEKKKKLKDGVDVHHYSAFDSFKGIMITSVIISFIIGIGIGDFVVALFYWITLLIPVWIAKLFLQGIGLMKFKNEYSIKFKCPHCNMVVWAYIPTLRMICPSCKKTLEYRQDKIYKITKENEDCFKYIQEQTNELLQKQIDNRKKTSKNNLSEIKELKELLDINAITQEEYEEKKKEILKKI